MKTGLNKLRLMLSAALAAAALCQSCVGDVATPEVESDDWIDIRTPPIVNITANAIVSDGQGRLYLGGDEYVPLWRSTDDGLMWTEKSTGLKPYCAVTALAVKGGETVFAALNGGGVFVSRNHGDRWTQVNNHLTDLNVLSLTIAADGQIIAGTYSGKIFRSIDDGGVWVEAEDDSIGAAVRALVTDSAGTIYAGTSGDGVFFSADSGRTWTASSSGLGDPFIYCLAIDNEGYILAGSGLFKRIYRSAGAGEPWVRIDGGAISGYIRTIATDRTGNIFAGTSGCGVFCSRDGGDSWERGETGLQGLSVGSLVCADDAMLAGTASYGVFRSIDGGNTWSPARNYSPTDPHQYESLRSPNYLSVDSCGTYYLFNKYWLLRSRDAGETWVRACYVLWGALYCLAIHPNSSLIAGTSQGIYISTDSGESWSEAYMSSSGSLRVHALEVARNGAIFARTEDGVIRSENGGTFWTNVLSEATVTSIATGAGGCVYLGTNYQGVLGSSDDGDTWRRMTDSLTVYSIAADRVGNVFAISNNGMLCSSDGGNTWKTIQLGEDHYWPIFVYNMVAAPGGEVAVVFDGEGKLYISEDCFSSWKTVPVPYTDSSISLSPDGHLFISEQSSPGLHRSREPLF
ncbi:MAG: hypothetical protein PHD74_10090, partial [Candidatus Krumholzibacteria bacterium]|nr:hypothetical protein [Candidatus Krumholzibacteria bacterium]